MSLRIKSQLFLACWWSVNKSMVRMEPLLKLQSLVLIALVVHRSVIPTTGMTPSSRLVSTLADRLWGLQTLHMATTKQLREWLGLSAIIMTSFSPEAFKSLLDFFMINWRHFAALHLQKWRHNEIIRSWNTSCAYWFFLTSSASVSKNMGKTLIFFLWLLSFLVFFLAIIT